MKNKNNNYLFWTITTTVFYVQLFIILLKLFDTITWTWFQVLLPGIIYFGLPLLILIISLIVFYIYIRRNRN